MLHKTLEIHQKTGEQKSAKQMVNWTGNAAARLHLSCYYCPALVTSKLMLNSYALAVPITRSLLNRKPTNWRLTRVIQPATVVHNLSAVQSTLPLYNELLCLTLAICGNNKAWRFIKSSANVDARLWQTKSSTQFHLYFRQARVMLREAIQWESKTEQRLPCVDCRWNCTCRCTKPSFQNVKPKYEIITDTKSRFTSCCDHTW